MWLARKALTDTGRRATVLPNHREEQTMAEAFIRNALRTPDGIGQGIATVIERA